MNRESSSFRTEHSFVQNSDTDIMHDTACDIGEGHTGLNNKPWQSCIEFSDIFFKSLEFGRIRGIVIIAAENEPEAVLNTLIQELIKRDILVAISGSDTEDAEKGILAASESFDETNAGVSELCDFIGITPVIYMNHRADHADMFDFFTQQACLASADIRDLPWAAITPSSPSGAQAASSDLEQICDTIFSMESDPVASADLLDDYIHEKRLKLEWCDRFHCSEETYS